MQRQNISHQIEQLLKRLNDENQDGAMNQEEPPQPHVDEESIETIHVYFVSESEEPEENVIDATPQTAKSHLHLFTYATIFFCLMLPLSAILFQLSLVFHPPIATVTIIPRVQTLPFTGTTHMGRLTHAITLSQSQTIPTTGKGHQDATKAAGTVTFYNGLFTSQTVAAGTIVTGADGVQVITDQDALIPAGNPPSYGQVTILAHAVHAGNKGNIPAYDINVACCFASVLAKNPEHFTGGQDARDFHIVAKHDIDKAASPMKSTLAQRMQGALQGQLQPNEQLFPLPCMPTVASDHQPGDEANQVQVTVSETCTAAAYNSQELKEKATQLLTSRAIKKLGAGYSLLGDTQVITTQATINQLTKKVVLSLYAQGTFVCALNYAEQEQMKHLIAGKTTQEALHLLTSLPGVARASIHWGDETKLPKDTGYIHITLFVV